MWILAKDKLQIVNLDHCDCIRICKVDYVDHITATLDACMMSNNIITLGEYNDKDQANDLFKSLIAILGCGDNLFVIPEEK
jgi:hypothetical protein